ncbi:hypothetical protein AB0F18_36565, partial [Streptomyces sp. NPDC029216]
PVPPPAPARRRRTVLIGGLLVVALTGGAVGLVQALPDGGSSGSSGSSGTQAKGAATPSPSTDDAPASANPQQVTPKTAPSKPQGSMLTPAAVRTAIAAFKEKTGTTTFADLSVYDGYVLAKIPTAPGAETLDAWEYRGGTARRTGADGTIDDGDPVIDMSTVNWDALPGLLEQSQRDLGVTAPSMRYVLVEPWMMDHVPCMRPYFMDEYGRGGYVLAGTDGKVKQVVKT